MDEVEETDVMDVQRSPRLPRHTRPLNEAYGRQSSPRVKKRKPRSQTGQESDEDSTSDQEDTSFSIGGLPYKPEGALPVRHDLRNLTKQITGSKPKSRNIEDGMLIFIFLCFLVVLFVVLVSWGYLSPSDNKHENLEFSTAEYQLRKELKVLREKFPSQAVNLWSSFMGGIKKIVEDEPNKPSVFLLLHQEDRGTSECLAKEVGKAAAKFLKDGSQDLVEIDGSELKNNRSFLEDYGVFTDQFRSSMERIGVMIVNNLQEIPATIAQTFHTFCDEVNPLVEKAVYFFTLRTTSTSRKSPVEVAEETLTSLWKNHLDRDRMDPLIVRMTSEVVVIKQEEKTPCKE
ncbi:uncharacterized protein TORIP isoform X2 [Anabrus simplex]